jgi:hypothetical protein
MTSAAADKSTRPRDRRLAASNVTVVFCGPKPENFAQKCEFRRILTNGNG